MSDDILQQAAQLITTQRQEQYGHPSVNFERIATGWQIIFDDGEFTPERVALAMVWTKICRQLHAHNQDNLIDAIGYILTIDHINERQQQINNILKDIENVDIKTFTLGKNNHWKDNV